MSGNMNIEIIERILNLFFIFVVWLNIFFILLIILFLLFN